MIQAYLENSYLIYDQLKKNRDSHTMGHYILIS
jgi:hypothetical protein